MYADTRQFNAKTLKTLIRTVGKFKNIHTLIFEKNLTEKYVDEIKLKGKW